MFTAFIPVRNPARPSKPLAVVLVSTQQEWHGGEQQARLLAEGLGRHGHRPFFLARRGGALAERMQREGFPLATFSGNGRSPLALWQIRRQLRRLKPDVLHYNDSHAMYATGLASLGLAIPARVASRRVDFAVRWPICYRVFCDGVICVSQAVARICRQSGVAGPLIRVAHDGVDPARVHSGDRQRGRRALGLLDDHILLLCVATLTDHKGHRFLLEALKSVLKRRPGICLALAGDGELREELQNRAVELGVEAHVRFLGYREDVPDLIHAADLFVLPSHMEGLCSTLIDVMMAGRPIVTTTAGGIPELIGGDGSGADSVAWSVPPRNPLALAEAIVDALDSPRQRALFAERAQRRAESMFTADHMVQASLDVYREVLNRS